MAWKNNISFNLEKRKTQLSCRESQTVVGKGKKKKKLKMKKNKMSRRLLFIYTVDITNNRKNVRSGLAVFLDALQTKSKSTSRKKEMYNPFSPRSALQKKNELPLLFPINLLI